MTFHFSRRYLTGTMTFFEGLQSAAVSMVVAGNEGVGECRLELLSFFLTYLRQSIFGKKNEHILCAFGLDARELQTANELVRSCFDMPTHIHHSSSISLRGQPHS